MGRARRFWASLRRLARDPGANALSGAAIGALAGVLAVAVSPLWLLLGLAAPLGRGLIEQATPDGGTTDAGAPDGALTTGDATARAVPLARETRTEAASDDDWLAVAQGATGGVAAPRAQCDQTSPSGVSDADGSYVEF